MTPTHADGTSPVVAAFMRPHWADTIYTAPEGEMCDTRTLASATGELNATRLAEGILRALEIPYSGPGSDLLVHAFRWLDLAQVSERKHPNLLNRYILPTEAATLAGQALAEWIKVNDWPEWGAPNHPYSVLVDAFMWAQSHG